MKVTTFALALVCMTVGLQATAQTATKPAAKATKAAAAAASGAVGKTLSMGQGAAGGPLLTRDELRTCLSQESSLRTRLADLESKRPALDKEKADLGAEQQTLRTERGPVDDFKRQADDLAPA